MKKITFLGLGAMGSRMASNLIQNGYDLCVWNRNADKSKPLLQQGATTAATPREAVNGADMVFSMVRDDQASRSVWTDKDTGALPGMKQGAIAIECSTLSTNWIIELNQVAKAQGISLLDAPVAGSRPQAEAAQLIFFVGGDKQIFDQAKPILDKLSSTVHHTGLSGTGATLKLVVNALFGIQVATMGELLSFLNTSNMDVQQALDILQATPVCSPASALAARSMINAQFAPMFPIELVTKDFEYFLESARLNNLITPQAQSTLGIYQQAYEKGFGQENITAVGKLYP